MRDLLRPGSPFAKDPFFDDGLPRRRLRDDIRAAITTGMPSNPTVARIGFWLGVAACLTAVLLPPGESLQRVAGTLAGSPDEALERIRAMQAAAGITALMACWWICGSLPLAATSLLPLVAFPLLGVMPADAVASCYGHPLIFLFLGGFVIARGVERWGLHRRIALQIVSRVGSGRRQLVLGFMLASAVLSMWISNTATAMMMLAIAMAVVQTLPETHANVRAHFASALLLGVGYGASIGGIATPIGTPPNIAFALIYSSQFPDASPIAFGGWMTLFLPLVALFLPLAWLILTRVVCPLPADTSAVTAAEIRAQLKRLGPLRGAERSMLLVFTATALLWVTRTIPAGATNWGWSHLLAGALDAAGIPFAAARISDTTIAIGMALLMFVLPAGRDADNRPRRLMDWETAERLPWGVLLLFGGGFAIAEAFAESGLSAWCATAFAELPLGHPLALLGGICTLMTFLTELTSNTATTNVMLPVIGQLSTALQVDPLPMMLAATLSASCAFMLPVATPPNAIVFGSGMIRMRDMLLAGLLLNIVGIVLISSVLYLAF